MTRPCIIILEAAGPDSRALARTATRAGLAVHAVTTPAQHRAYDRDLRSMLQGTLTTDLTDPPRAARDVVDYTRRIGARAVLTTNEYLTELAARTCHALDLPGNDPALAAAARNKTAMHQALAAGHVTVPTTFTTQREDDLHALLADGRVEFPCVLKPVEAAGSAGVGVASDTAQAVASWHAAHQAATMYGPPSDRRVIVQQHIDGDEYSVETITQDGTATHLCATAKTVTPGRYRVETGHSLPAVLPDALRQALYHQVDLALRATGIRNGASHTEVIIDRAGRCTVIETAARIGAGRIGALIEHALGIDLWQVLLDVALGRSATLAPTRRAHAAVLFLTSATPGRLNSVSGLPSPGPRVPEVHLRRSPGQPGRHTARKPGPLGPHHRHRAARPGRRTAPPRP